MRFACYRPVVACCLLYAASGLLGGCSTVPSGIESPIVTLVTIEPKEMTLFEQRFDAQLRIQNPNDTALDVHGVRCDIELNERKFAYAMSGQKIAIPRFGSEVINVQMITGTGSILRQLRELSRPTGARIRYRLKGTIFVESPSRFRLPFDDAGDLDLMSEEPADRS